MNTQQTERLLQAAGLMLWAVVGLPVLMRLLRRQPEAGDVTWFIAHLAWAAAFVRGSAPQHRTSVASSRVLLFGQTVGALYLIHSGRGVSEPALLAVIAAQLPFCLTLPYGIGWVALQTAALAVVLGPPWASAAGEAGGVFSFQLFAFGAGHLAASESRARRELAVANAELRATRDLMAESRTMSERLRIARELHDTLGHHLTALSLNLEVARHVAEGKAREHVDKAHALTRLLLAEVRDVVGPLRENLALDVAGALRTMASAIPAPAVHLEIKGDLALEDSAVAQAVVRCVQEAMTNAVRHAGARNIWIDVVREGGTVIVHARDDGRGAPGFRAGHGLTGMRERVEAVGGRLELESRPGQGFCVRAQLPAPEPLTS